MITRVLDAKIVVAGVAGIFLALGVVGAVLIGIGHFTSAIGQEVNIGPVAQAGDAITGFGVDVVAFLVVLAIIVIIAFLYVVFH